jgi:hypothetical protein
MCNLKQIYVTESTEASAPSYMWLLCAMMCGSGEPDDVSELWERKKAGHE